MLRPTPGDPWGVEQHHWNTGAKENQQLNPGGPSKAKRIKKQKALLTLVVLKLFSFEAEYVFSRKQNP